MIYNSFDNSVCYAGTPMIIEIDKFDTITYANRTFYEISGYEKSELIGVSHKVLRHPDMPKSIYTTMWDTISHNISWQGYVKYRYKEAQSCWVKLHIVPVVDESGVPIRFILSKTAPDIETVAQVQQRYSKLIEEEQKLLFKAEIANRVSIQSIHNNVIAL